MKGIAVPLTAALVFLVVGCIGGPGPVAVVTIANEMNSPGEFQWQSTGIFDSGFFSSVEHEPVRACAIYARGVGPGHQIVKVSIADQSLELALDATNSEERYVLISPIGAISEVGAAAIPADPCSHAPPT